ncbi:TPA: hypothetical protein LVL75_005434 [Klebsiella oxytoca]|nr:hypothetical protein [Klebsiella oxytoca]HBM3228798.1 hypothetical protein [Klebsiella oxytoca]
MSSNISDPSNIINFFVAFGTCAAVAVALIAKGQASFENTFSILLAQHNEQLRKLKEHKNYENNFSSIFNLQEEYNLIELNRNMHNFDDFFGSYFRVLYHLLKHIDKKAGYHPFDFKEKQRYTSLVRAFLDNETTLLLSINCAHAKPDNQYYPYRCLIERYAFFEHLILDREKFIDYIRANPRSISSAYTLVIQAEDNFLERLISDIKTTYHKTAFGANEDIK